ncbi:class I SAM-dependent methyltransferase [Pleomorphovibrio marinus]|uniref:class I SAM-dependent methyltransferase n=1 Tax=Pleomorphovibrio marinus TaxID=2164132 RepID=UPI000E0AB842|nr:class I SAM-dependent methyltransferase [Pleomorphovibrio marinus]
MKRKLKKLFAPSDQPSSLGNRFREKRFKFFEDYFLKTFKKRSVIKVLDVGGTEAFWKDKKIFKNREVHITLLNLSAEKVSRPNIKSLKGDATDLSIFGNKSFDLVFSNSVIEHLHNFENQKKMAKEILRVGKHYYVQSPNKYFFMEPHYALPLFQFVPIPIRRFVLTKTKLSRMQKWEPAFAEAYLTEIRLLSYSEMKQLFPEANIYYEKFLGMNKSFVFHNLND